MNQHLENLETSQASTQERTLIPHEKSTPRKGHSMQEPQRERYVNDDNSNYPDEFEEFDSPRRLNRHQSNKKDEIPKRVKLTILAFQGKSDPNAYLEWERQVELILDYHWYYKAQKVKLDVVGFIDCNVLVEPSLYQLKNSRSHSIETWSGLNMLMWKRFVLSHYHRKLHHKLQTLTQGNGSVGYYFKEMEMAFLRTNAVEDKEATMARFMGGLHMDVVDVLDMHYYVNIENLVE